MAGSRGRPDASVVEQWTRVRAMLRADVGDAAFNSWLKPLTLSEVVGNRLRIAVPTRFMRDWVESNYADLMTRLWQGENTVQTAGAPPRAARADDTAPPRFAEEAESAGLRETLASAARSLTATLDPRFEFKNFVVGRTNELAHAAARRVAESEKVPFNPLFLYGGVGLGKTHLMHAIAWHITKMQPDRIVLYMSAEKFMYQFIRALRFKTIMDFKEQFRSVDVLMIDDIQFIAGKDSTQEEFFHTFNALVDANRQIVVSADKVAAGLRPCRRHPSDGLRVASWHHAVEGRAAWRRNAAEGAGVPRAQDRIERARTRRCAQPHRRACDAGRPADDARIDAGSAARPAARQ